MLGRGCGPPQARLPQGGQPRGRSLYEKPIKLEGEVGTWAGLAVCGQALSRPPQTCRKRACAFQLRTSAQCGPVTCPGRHGWRVNFHLRSCRADFSLGHLASPQPSAQWWKPTSGAGCGPPGPSRPGSGRGSEAPVFLVSSGRLCSPGVRGSCRGGRCCRSDVQPHIWSPSYFHLKPDSDCLSKQTVNSTVQSS